MARWVGIARQVGGWVDNWGESLLTATGQQEDFPQVCKAGLILIIVDITIMIIIIIIDFGGSTTQACTQNTSTDIQSSNCGVSSMCNLHS